jgi:acyl-CoA thioester hydrolase
MEILEEARWELITEKGWGWSRVRESQVGPVVLEAKLKFSAEVGNREEVLILTRFLNFRGKVGEIEQVIKKADGTEACRATFLYGIFDLKERRLLEPDEEWKRIISNS